MDIFKVHNASFEVKTMSARINNLSWAYFEIASEEIGRFLELDSINITLEDDPEKYLEIGNEIQKTAFKTIVFSAMSCEAAIYDLAAIQLGDEYVSKYLDKLDLVSKWITIPKLICGKSLDVNGPAINSLKALVKLRNLLVHHKSSSGHTWDKSFGKSDKEMEKIIQGARESVKTVVLLSLDINRLLEIQTAAFPFFEKNDTTSFREFPKHIKDIIDRCHVILAPHNP